MPKVSGVIPSAAAGVPLIPTKLPGVIPSSAAEVPLTPAKRTRLEYITTAKTGLIDPVPKNDYYFNFPSKNSQKTQVSYTKAAKNQKKVTYDATVYKEVSIKHFLDNSEPHQLKRMCMGGSDRRIGCSWRQFPDNINEALDYVTDATVDLYQTVNINKDITVIKINNFQKVGVKTMVNSFKETLNPIGEISFIQKNDEKVEIPNLIEVGECSIISGSKKQILKQEPKAQGKPNEVAKNLVKNKPNQLQMENKQNANSLDKSQKKVFESLTPNENNKMLNMYSDLSSNLSYPSSPVAIDMTEPEPNKDNYAGRINIVLIEQLCEQQKNTDIKMDEQ
ncbi:hypothetical protein BB561_002176 [Smittium simulii]|uniref:Uncharacterized protein n=1 Tax=Smittium simulii TaxID=133385 RepID=A0A2T9YRE6_9FUNG|nr:hypothetical protein BB561_002176 [Smittium simulii]